MIQHEDLNEPSLIKNTHYSCDPSMESFDQNISKAKRAANELQSLSSKLSLITLHTIPQSYNNSLLTSRKDHNTSYSSFSTFNSLEQQNPPHILTGRAVTAHQRAPSQNKQRAKSSMTAPTSSFTRRPQTKSKFVFFSSFNIEQISHLLLRLFYFDKNSCFNVKMVKQLDKHTKSVSFM